MSWFKCPWSCNCIFLRHHYWLLNITRASNKFPGFLPGSPRASAVYYGLQPHLFKAQCHSPACSDVDVESWGYQSHDIVCLIHTGTATARGQNSLFVVGRVSPFPHIIGVECDVHDQKTVLIKILNIRKYSYVLVCSLHVTYTGTWAQQGTSSPDQMIAILLQQVTRTSGTSRRRRPAR